MARQYTHTGGLKPRKSAFNLSYEKKFTCRMGEMIPVMCDEVIPGDVWKINNEMVIRFQPMVTPMLHDVKAKVDYYFCPYRLLWENWEDFITGGPDGDDISEIPLYNETYVQTANINRAKYSTWDYLGMPVGINPLGFTPILFPWIAYEQIWFEYFRDEDFEKVQGTDIKGETNPTNSWKKYLNEMTINGYNSQSRYKFGDIKRKDWQKDYFTSARPDRQKGTSPAIPLVGQSNAIFSQQGLNIFSNIGGDIPNLQLSAGFHTDVPAIRIFDNTNLTQNMITNLNVRMQSELNKNTIDLGEIQGADINDIRNGFQVQKYLERNQRAGSRYTEQLRARWGTAPKDYRLDRPEYIGGTRTPIIISEVVQTSQTDETPQGNMAGHGISADRNHVCSYRAQEWGLIMGIMTIQPKLSYMSQGINKQWLRRTRYDFPTPEFVNLSEQPVLEVELYATQNATQNAIVLGYQGIYDESRTKHDMVCADMRDTMATWHMARKFDGIQNLNTNFLEMKPQNRPFVGESDEFRNCIVNFANVIKAIRPLPFMAEPGLIDHH
jgi:hypothetical protein